MRKYILFRADGDQPGWEDRKFQHTQGLTEILAEHFDSSKREIPEPGYRPPQFVRVEEEYVPGKHGWSTHYKPAGDWVVSRVETYTPDLPLTEFDMIVICYCKYDPIDAELRPMPDRIVSIDSFGGDKEKYEAYKKELAAV